MNVLYSFPHRLGAGQICYTAWQQATHASAHAQTFTVHCGSLERALPARVRVTQTLRIGPFRLPYRVLGRNNACLAHDYLTARYIRKHAREIDIVHGWPLGSRLSFAAARAAGITTVVERPNAHTGFAFDVVDQECRRIGFTLPPDHEHRPNERTLQTEEAEYAAADFLLCPSDFVRDTFLAKGFPAAKLLRHQYGYDPTRVQPRALNQRAEGPLTVVFAGVAAPRKGLHIALQAWKDADIARQGGQFLICGSFVTGFAEFLGPLLTLPGVKVLGHRKDLPAILSTADVMVLPSFEEGSALVTYEGRGAGCVLLVSHAAGAVARDGVDALIHSPGDVTRLREHFDLISRDRAYLERLRAESLAGIGQLTWEHAGARLDACYHQALIALGRVTRAAGNHSA